MNRRTVIILFSLLAAFMVLSGSWAGPGAVAATESMPAKQIAAPPGDFAALALPEAAQTGIRSRTAMTAVRLEPQADGSWRWNGTLPLDSGLDVQLLLFAPGAAAWRLALTSPAGERMELDAAQRRPAGIGLGEESYPGERYALGQLAPGLWQAHITADAPPNPARAAHGYLALANESPYGLYTHLAHHELWLGREVGLVAYVFDGDADEEKLARQAAGEMPAAPEPLHGLALNVTLAVTLPDGSRETVTMAATAKAGVFVGGIVATQVGHYLAQITVEGQSAEGHPFRRTSEHVFPVVARTLTLNEAPVTAAVAGEYRWTLPLPASALAQPVGDVRVSAQLWGTSAAGEMAPVAWLGGVVTPTQQRRQVTLPVSLDIRWLALAQVRAPFELRDVRIHDLASHVPLARQERLPVLQPASLRQDPATLQVAAVSDEMLMGAPPAASGAPAATGEPSPQSSGRLMLVHGYCSNAVWPTSHFTNFAVFQDFQQNRSHNQFALLIRDQGAQYSSFGVVAHSQGGAASLHLYTYYWSGLDWSSGSRLIQSVGAPYRGTALAGNLALLGQVFGAGCGANWDLTYDGAALWLSGIPSWARSRVYYHTTSFTWVWWRYDYCHLATDLFLTDPEDGTTEQWAGQLAGAHNLGHKTGWCHTAGMRDPAQYNDYTRNVNMNAHANR
jgi:hypothetical protein